MADHSDRLLLNLVNDPAAKKTPRGKVNFVTAMQQLGIASVFDIIGQPKPQFVERLGEICDADGALAYENALCYATQIGRLYREHQVSSGKPQHLTQRTGVRALTEVGPSYPNLFKENWDEFCKVGAIAAIDSPVAYLRSLFHFATRTLEGSGQGTHPKILLRTRRPDIEALVIDPQSTFVPRPMLDQVNEVLKGDIQRYQQGIPGMPLPVYDLLANRRHPFIFPYNFAHHQCRLGLAQNKLQLGELNYRVSFELPATQGSRNVYGTVQNAPHEAQRLLSGLSPQQQKLLIEPSLFTTFYLSKAQLVAGWDGPWNCHLNAHKAVGMGFVLRPGQSAIQQVVPPADALVSDYNGVNLATLEFTKAGTAQKHVANFKFGTRTTDPRYLWRFNYLNGPNGSTLLPNITWDNSGPAFPVFAGYRAAFVVTTTTGTLQAPAGLAALSFTLELDENITWTNEQVLFFRNHFDVVSAGGQVEGGLNELKTFLDKTATNAEQVEALLSQRNCFPRLSPNCPSTNVKANGAGRGKPYPHASHYGACYVNGQGSDRYDSVTPATTASIQRDQFDNSMGLKEVKTANATYWYLTKTSPNRFDRLQRMIRLQRWFDLPFAELDTLIISAIRSEGEHNLTMDLNINTLRVLGVYRYLSGRYSITAEQFAAFVHDLTPYATGERVPLFDQVFNKAALFDVPLVLDQQPFNLAGTDAASKRTVSQLCAGLSLQPTQTSFFRLAGQTQLYVGPLRRDLATVSSLYRQARMAQLFGLTPEDSWALVDLLGGERYQRLLSNGRLAQQGERPLSPMIIEAKNSDATYDIRLTLVADPLEAGDVLRLLPGSALLVNQGVDFTQAAPTRLFTLDWPPQPALANVLRNVDGSTLSLAPIAPGQTLSLSGRVITREAWQAITEGAATLTNLRVKCGAQGNRDMKVENIYEGEPLSAEPDILDLLMQMDWAVTWLKDSKQTVPLVRQLLGLDPGDYLPPEGLTDRVAKLAEDTRAVLVSDAQLLALNLPTHEKTTQARGPGDLINWRSVLLPLLDPTGLVKEQPLELADNTQAQLQAALVRALQPLALDPAVRAASLEKLGTLLMAAHGRQLRLIEGLAQELVNLPMDRTQVVVHWAQTSVYQLLAMVLQVGTNAEGSSTLIVQLKAVLRHAKAALHLRLSTSALRLFLVHPQWLGAAQGGPLSWASLYLLGRYSQWFNRQSQAEEALLGYFISANPAKAQLKNKALRSAVNQASAEVLANLLGWRQEDIARLFQELPLGRATSLAEVDWVLRCQQACAASGLTATDLLAATALHADSASVAWQAAGEAAIAASRRA